MSMKHEYEVVPQTPEREPDTKIAIPNAHISEAKELWLWYEDGKTYVWGSGEFMTQEIYMCQGRITPEEALQDYQTEGGC